MSEISKKPKSASRIPVSAARLIFAENFRRAREAIGFTQSQTAKLLKVNQPFLSGVETGQTNITIDRMAYLASFVGKPLHELLDPKNCNK